MRPLSTYNNSVHSLRKMLHEQAHCMEADYGQLRNWLEEVIEEKASLEARIEDLEGDKAEVRLPPKVLFTGEKKEHSTNIRWHARRTGGLRGACQWLHPYKVKHTFPRQYPYTFTVMHATPRIWLTRCLTAPSKL